MAAPPSHADQHAANALARADMSVYRIGNPGHQKFAIVSQFLLRIGKVDKFCLSIKMKGHNQNFYIKTSEFESG